MSAILDARRGFRTWRDVNERRRDWRGAEPIDMCERRYGYFPQAFVWRGCRYDVYAVERCWTVARRGRSGRVERHCFRVRCSFHNPTNGAAHNPADSVDLGPVQDRREGTFEVYQDVKHNTWHLRQRVA